MRTIVFDLDGTLVDTAPDLISTLNFVLADEGLPPVAYEDARRMIGGGARCMIERALIAGGHNVLAAELDRMFGAFIAHYGAHITDRSRPFPSSAPWPNCPRQSPRSRRKSFPQRPPRRSPAAISPSGGRRVPPRTSWTIRALSGTLH